MLRDQKIHEDESKRAKPNIYKVPFWAGLVVISVLSLLFLGIHRINEILPTPKLLIDELKNPESFIAERAALDLKNLTDFGPKIVGSYANEYLVVEFLTNKIKQIINEADSSQLIELDVQIATSGYWTSYSNIQNVVVKLHGQYNNSQHSLLVNSHYDSVPSSPGGTDDGINVAAMLEILRKLSKKRTRLNNNVIFLFNGAEETPLQGSHAFVKQHKWAKECKVVINLEGHGGGGKAILFQTGPDSPWLTKYYRNVPHPFGNVISEEIFQSGQFPSDTDFRIFRDFGNMRGFDISFYQDSYRYHTAFDGYTNIPLGSYQHVGDNLLHLVKSLAETLETSINSKTYGKSVYFDVFSLFMITYSDSTAYILNLITALFSVVVFGFGVNQLLGLSSWQYPRRKLWKYIIIVKYFAIVLAAILGGWLLAGLFVFALATFLDLSNSTLSWYANPWMIFGLYVIPIIGLSGSLMIFTNYQLKGFSLSVRSQLQGHILRLIWTVILIVGTYLRIRSVFVLNILIFFNALGFSIIHMKQLGSTVKFWQLIYAISIFFPAIFLMHEMTKFLNLFVPILGRMGSDVNPEFYIGFFLLLLIFLIVSPLTVLTNNLTQARYYFMTLGTIFGIFLALALFVVFPYNENPDSPKLQRHYIMHTEREFYNQFNELIQSDAGFVMANMDRNSPDILKPYVKELNRIENIHRMCQLFTLCALPLSQIKTTKKIERTSNWIPTSGVSEFPKNETLDVKITSEMFKMKDLIRINYTITVFGPDRLSFYLTPRKNTTLIDISLVDNSITESSNIKFFNRPVYVVNYQLGKRQNNSFPLIFNIIMEKAENQTGPMLDFAVTGRYVHEPNMQRTADFTKFLSQFPKWTHVISWLAAYKSYII